MSIFWQPCRASKLCFLLCQQSIIIFDEFATYNCPTPHQLTRNRTISKPHKLSNVLRKVGLVNINYSEPARVWFEKTAHRHCPIRTNLPPRRSPPYWSCCSVDVLFTAHRLLQLNSCCPPIKFFFITLYTLLLLLIETIHRSRSCPSSYSTIRNPRRSLDRLNHWKSSAVLFGDHRHRRPHDHQGKHTTSYRIAQHLCDASCVSEQSFSYL